MKIATENPGHKLALQKDIEQAVVQIFAQISAFNWQEPYKMNNQGEHLGSGFFCNDSGYIVTNFHVIEDAKSVWIQIPAFGQATFFVDIISSCPDRDIALLKIRTDDRIYINSVLGFFPYITLGNSDTISRSEPITVAGYPLGQYRVKTLTGVISGWDGILGQSLLQITSPINPGNSGGPVINNREEVIGIATATVLPSQNIGYAIPINEFKIIEHELMNGGLVQRPKLGIVFNYASDALAEIEGNPTPAGLYISKVVPNSIADQVGIQEGDMLYALNGMRIDAYGDTDVTWTADKVSIHDLLARISTNEQIKCSIYRKGKLLEPEFNFQLTTPPPIRRMFPMYEKIDYVIIAGLVVMQLSENHILELIEEAPFLLEFLKIEKKLEPMLIISHILPGSQAQLNRNFTIGMLITHTNELAVQTIAEFRNALTLSNQSEFLTIKTSENNYAAFPWDDVLIDEVRLSQYFSYPLVDYSD